MLLCVTAKDGHLRFPIENILVPVFSVHTYFAPGDGSFTVERLRSHPPACAHSSAPIVSIHTLLELGAQCTN